MYIRVIAVFINKFSDLQIMVYASRGRGAKLPQFFWSAFSTRFVFLQRPKLSDTQIYTKYTWMILWRYFIQRNTLNWSIACYPNKIKFICSDFIFTMLYCCKKSYVFSDIFYLTLVISSNNFCFDLFINIF